jgi:hypothetical protein
VKGDLDGIRLHSENLSDLARSKVGAVAQGDQFTTALVEALERTNEG